MRISARNRLVGKIEELQIGDVMAHVVVSVGEHGGKRDFAAQRGRNEFASRRYGCGRRTVHGCDVAEGLGLPLPIQAP